MVPTLRLTPKEELELQQLQQIAFWQNSDPLTLEAGSQDSTPIAVHGMQALPKHWDLTRGLVLHDWQSECVDKWFAAGRKGVVKVVTGAGKTVLALAVIERLQQTVQPDLRVAVVVPTVVLLDQWYSEILKSSNLTPGYIGLLGAGRSTSFQTGVRIILAVLNSASKKLAQDVQLSGVSDRLLLIVDESHRAGAPEMRKVFETRRAASLGLSATPERELDVDEGDEESSETNASRGVISFDSTVIGKELGDVIFELNYADAIRQGILPPFRIVHYGLPLSVDEKQQYSSLSREISDLQGDLQTRNRRGLELVRWCKSRSGRQNPKAVRYLSLLSERKRFLYRIKSRSSAVEQILQNHFKENQDAKAILFHESIEEVMRLFEMLRRLGFEVVAEHSRFPDPMRAKSIHLFRDGIARVIVSARSLIEGFNVPSADIGIVVAASASVRQRIQTLGRLLRKNRQNDGTEKGAKLFVLYARETVDELIYEKADWEHFVGAERNDYYQWDPVDGSPPVLIGEPPRRPPLSEEEVASSQIHCGDEYPGDLSQGESYSLDMQGNILDETGRPISPHPELRDVLTVSRRRPGRFRVTPTKHLVFALEKDALGAWRGVYLGRLTSPPRGPEQNQVSSAAVETTANMDLHPSGRIEGKTFHVLQRDRRLIARKERGQIRFVLPLDQISDPAKRGATERIQQALRDAHAKGHRINRITVRPNGDVVYFFENRPYFLGQAPEGQSGFEFEELS